MSDNERRLYGRTQPANVVTYVSIGHQRVTASVDNLSPGGAFLRTSTMALLGQEIGLEFVEGGQKRVLMVNCRVVSAIDPATASRLRTIGGLGVEFTGMSIIDHRRMKAMIEAFAAAAPVAPVAPPAPEKVALRRYARGIDPTPAPFPKEPEPAPGIKRRRNRRVEGKDATAHARINGEVVAFSLPVKNLSMGGLFLNFADPIAVGTAIDLEIQVSGKSMVLSGQVVSVPSLKTGARERGASVRFGPMTRATAERLRTAITTLLPAGAGGLREEEPGQGYLEDPLPPRPAARYAEEVKPAAVRTEFDFDAGDLSVAPLQTEDLRGELARLKLEIKVREERIAEIELTLRDADG